MTKPTQFLFGQGEFAVGHRRDAGSSFAQSMLNSDSKTMRAFDHLADLINGALEYPDLFVEEGIQGVSSLDLYFDHDGKIDEARSQFLGSNRWLRGALVKASREGLRKWYISAAVGLHRDQFKDQYFRAEFSLSSGLKDLSEVKKESDQSYTFVRRRFVNHCILPGTIDVVCTVMQVKGFVEKRVSRAYQLRVLELKDRLDAYDDLELRGINREIQKT